MQLQLVSTRAPLRRSHARAHSSSTSPLPIVWHDTGAALRHSHPHLVAAGALVPGGFSAAEFAARRTAVRASLHSLAASALPSSVASSSAASSLPLPSCSASASSSSVPSSPPPSPPAASRPLRAALLVPSQPESCMSNDVHFPYRASSDQLWLTGFTEPDCLTVVQSQGDQCRIEGHDAGSIANAPFVLLVRCDPSNYFL